MRMNIKDIENRIDQVWETLAICRLPLHLALFIVLSIFEDKNASMRDGVIGGNLDRRFAEGGTFHLREGLQILTPLLFEKCPRAGFGKKYIQVLRNLRASPLPALEASNLSQCYS